MRAATVACFVTLVLGACKPSSNEGFVAVNVPRGLIVPPLALALDSWLGSPGPEVFLMKADGSPVVLRRRPGSYQLLVKRYEQLQPLCRFDVKQDRVTTITLKPIGRELKCEIIA